MDAKVELTGELIPPASFSGNGKSEKTPSLRK
jgi:hypothetical protein